MRLLLNVSHIIFQRFTIIARFIGFSLLALQLKYTGYRAIFAPCYFHPFSLAKSFTLSKNRPDIVVLRSLRDKMRNLSSLSPKFAHCEESERGENETGPNIPLYTVLVI